MNRTEVREAIESTYWQERKVLEVKCREILKTTMYLGMCLWMSTGFIWLLATGKVLDIYSWIDLGLRSLIVCLVTCYPISVIFRYVRVRYFRRQLPKSIVDLPDDKYHWLLGSVRDRRNAALRSVLYYDLGLFTLGHGLKELMTTFEELRRLGQCVQTDPSNPEAYATFATESTRLESHASWTWGSHVPTSDAPWKKYSDAVRRFAASEADLTFLQALREGKVVLEAEE